MWPQSKQFTNNANPTTTATTLFDSGKQQHQQHFSIQLSNASNLEWNNSTTFATNAEQQMQQRYSDLISSAIFELTPEQCVKQQQASLIPANVNCSSSSAQSTVELYTANNVTSQFNPSDLYFSDFQELWIRKSWMEIMIRVGFVAPILLLGILGNVTIIYSMCKFKTFRSKPTNVFILNMAIADLLTTLVCPSAALLTNIYQFYILGSFFCRLEGFVKITCLLVSSYSLIVLSSDWLVCVVKPCRTRMSLRQVWFTLAAIWISSVVMASPLFVWRHLRERHWRDLVEVWCCEQIQYTKYYWLVIIFFLIYLPTFFMTIVLVVILAQMDKFEAKLRRSRTLQSNSSLSINMKYRRRIVKILFTYLLTSIICWTPLQFTVIYRHFRSEAIPSLWFFELTFFAQLSATLTVAMNPIIFGFLSQPFRRMVAKTLMFRFFNKIIAPSANRDSDNNEIHAMNQRNSHKLHQHQQQRQHPNQTNPKLHQHHHRAHHHDQDGVQTTSNLSSAHKHRSSSNGQHLTTATNRLTSFESAQQQKRVSFNTAGRDNPTFELEVHQQQPHQLNRLPVRPSPLDRLRLNGGNANSPLQLRPLSLVSMDSINIEENLRTSPEAIEELEGKARNDPGELNEE